VRWEAAAGFGALAVGLTVAWVTNSAFDARYASMMFPLFALVVAYGFTVFGSRAVMAGALTVLVVTGFVGAARNVTDKRTQAGQVAAVITAEAKPEDAVVYCPDQVGPGVSRLLGGRHDLVQLTFPAGASPELVNWVDYKRRIDATDPARFASEALDRTGTGHTLWYVYNSGYHGVEGKCEGVAAALQDSGRAQRVRVVADDKTFFEPDYLIEFSSR
jgi:hypothetical protein